jgi:hypothetical protein
MAVTIARTAWIDDDGTGTTGTVINNAWKTEMYNQIDGALAQVLPLAGGTLTGDLKFTDATYDIGKAGATRPRSVHVSQSVVIGTAVPDASYRMDVAGQRSRFTPAGESYAVGVRYSEAQGAAANFWFGASNSATPDGVFSRSDGIERFRILNAGGVRLAATPGFVAGDKYLTVDASGNVHVSAIGPAS